MTNSCQCSICKNACKYRPGWFIPDQIESLLLFFSVKIIRDLLSKDRLVIDWYSFSDTEFTLILAPNIIFNNEIYYPKDPRGKCIFYKEGKCSIYRVRPYECREYHHEEEENEKLLQDRHKNIALKWRNSTQLETFRSKVYIDNTHFSILELFLHPTIF